MTGHRTVTLKNHLSELERVGQEVEAFCEEAGVAAKATFQLNLALDEVLTNVISYGYADTEEHEITVRLAIEDKYVVIEVEDDGREFNPLEVMSPAMDVLSGQEEEQKMSFHPLAVTLPERDRR